MLDKNKHAFIFNLTSPVCDLPRMNNTCATLDWNDTFLSLDHLKGSYPGYKLEMEGAEGTQTPPFR